MKTCGIQWLRVLDLCPYIRLIAKHTLIPHSPHMANSKHWATDAGMSAFRSKADMQVVNFAPEAAAS
jgi:hypothetical protein